MSDLSWFSLLSTVAATASRGAGSVTGSVAFTGAVAGQGTSRSEQADDGQNEHGF